MAQCVVRILASVRMLSLPYLTEGEDIRRAIFIVVVTLATKHISDRCKHQGTAPSRNSVNIGALEGKICETTRAVSWAAKPRMFEAEAILGELAVKDEYKFRFVRKMPGRAEDRMRYTKYKEAKSGSQV